MGALRAKDSKYGESNDNSENSDFLLLHQKDPFGELFSEIYTLKVPANLHFFEIYESSKYRSINRNVRYAKLYIFNRPVQKEGNLPRFRIHAVCNLNIYHSSELKFILKQVCFVYFSAI